MPGDNVVAGAMVVALGSVVAGGIVVAGAVVTDVAEVVVVGGGGAEPVNHGKDVVDTAVDWGAVDGGVTGDVNRSGPTASDPAWDTRASPLGEWAPPPASNTLGNPHYTNAECGQTGDKVVVRAPVRAPCQAYEALVPAQHSHVWPPRLNNTQGAKVAPQSTPTSVC